MKWIKKILLYFRMQSYLIDQVDFLKRERFDKAVDVVYRRIKALEQDKLYIAWFDNEEHIEDFKVAYSVAKEKIKWTIPNLVLLTNDMLLEIKDYDKYKKKLEEAKKNLEVKQ